MFNFLKVKRQGFFQIRSCTTCHFVLLNFLAKLVDRSMVFGDVFLDMPDDFIVFLTPTYTRLGFLRNRQSPWILAFVLPTPNIIVGLY